MIRALFFLAVAMLVFSASVIAEEIRYDSKGYRDPLIPLVTEEGIVNQSKFDPTDLKVEGIVFDPTGGSMVLINGEFYKEGDHVNGANVITIFRDRAVLSQSDEEKTLWIREEIIDAAGSESAQKGARS